MGASVISSCCVHSTPGRMRIRLAKRHGDARGLIEVAEAIACIPGVRDVQANPLTGSVLVHFDPRRVVDREILARFEQIGLSTEPAPAASGHFSARSLAWQVGATVGKELVKAALVGAVGSSPVGRLLALI